MNPADLEALARAGESETLEFKRTAGWSREVMRTLCAVLNNLGGRVKIGVEPDGRIVGQNIGRGTLENLTNELRKIEPPAFPSIDRIPIGSMPESMIRNARIDIRPA